MEYAAVLTRDDIPPSQYLDALPKIGKSIETVAILSR
jgi:hypothetical protein